MHDPFNNIEVRKLNYCNDWIMYSFVIVVNACKCIKILQHSTLLLQVPVRCQHDPPILPFLYVVFFSLWPRNDKQETFIQGLVLYVSWYSKLELRYLQDKQKLKKTNMIM
jgi:hypothetical protein